MAEEIIIRTVLDTREIDRGARAIEQRLSKAFSAAGGSLTVMTRSIKDQETAALRLAQAQARLAVAGGDVTKAQVILSGALAGTTRETLTTINAQTQMIQVQNRATRSTKELADGMANLGRKLTIGVSAPLVGLAIAAVKTATDFDSLKRGLISVSGSSAEAEKQLTRLKEVAKLPGLGFKEAIQGSINLQAAGLSAERSEKALKAFGNALATVGKGKSELDGVILALSQIESKGKVSAEEINQLAERVPQIRKAMIAAFGTADTEVIQKAKITSGKFIDAVTAELAKLPQVTGGARNTFENLRDSIEQSLLPLGNKLLETILPAIEKLTPKILGLLEGFQGLSSGTQQTVIAFGALAIATGPLIGALGSLLTVIVRIRELGGVSALLGAGAGLAGILAAPAGAAALGVILSQGELEDRIRALQARGDRSPLGLQDPNAPTKLDFGGDKRFGGLDVLALQRQLKGGAPAIDAVALAKANEAAAKAARAGKKQPKAPPKDLLSAAFVKTREFDLAAAQREIDSHMAELAGATFDRPIDRQAQLAGFSASNAERLRQISLETATLEQNTAEKAQKALEKNERLLSNSARFMRGFADATISVGDAFDRFGQSVAQAFGNVRGLFDGLKRAVLDFFNDLLGGALQNLVRSTLGGLFGGVGGSLGGSIFAQAAGGGITVPASVSQSGAGGILGKIFGGGGGGAISSAATSGSAGGGFSLGGLFGGLASAAPLLGLGLGSGFGGRSTAGQILGAIGGGAVGLGVSFGASIFGAGGGLGGAALAALGPAALIGVPLLVGSILLGKAKQRRSDEEASGEFLRQALAAIDQLASGISSGQIDGGQARAIFENQILGQFIQQIRTLKTRSVVESRLTNQVQDLRNVFEARIPPLIADQQQRAATQSANALAFRRQIPEFASGGIVAGQDRGFDSVRALLRPGEMVLNQQQQARVQAQAGPGVFDRAGVPRINQTGAFAGGGFAQGGPQPIEINIEAQVVIGKDDATRIVVVGADSPQGRSVTVKNVRQARKDRDI